MKCSIYLIIYNIIARILKPMISPTILDDQFGFLNGRKIQEEIGISQEGLHIIKVRKMPSFIFNLDLSKAYNKVSWSYKVNDASCWLLM